MTIKTKYTSLLVHLSFYDLSLQFLNLHIIKNRPLDPLLWSHESTQAVKFNDWLKKANARIFIHS